MDHLSTYEQKIAPTMITPKTLLHLKQALIDDDIISAESLIAAETAAKKEGLPLSQMLVSSGAVKIDRLTEFIGNQMNIPYISLDRFEADPHALAFIPEKLARRYQILPLYELESVLTIAISDPLDIISMDEVANVAQCKIEVVVASNETIHTAIETRYGCKERKQRQIEMIAEAFQKTLPPAPPAQNHYANEINEIRLAKEAASPSTHRMVNQFIAQAVVEGASDIHLDPKKNGLKLRFRIDGYLFDRHLLSASVIPAIIARIKAMSGLEITEKKNSQTGRIHFLLAGETLDIETSVFPTIHGESIVLKIREKDQKIPSLQSTGITEKNRHCLEKAIKASRGIIFAVGPSGSGKTSTLYSLMNILSREGKNIVTIEDPIAYETDELIQSQIDNDSDSGFSDALKSIIHQDPDVIYISEIRDHETARLALRAALNGQLVLASLHTTSAGAAITRLRDFGLQEGLISSALNCSFSQRLVRKLCPLCRIAYEPKQWFLKDYKLPSDTLFYKAAGCESCSGIGFKGRTAISEVLNYGQEIKMMIVNKAGEHEISKVAHASGMSSLFEDGLQKIVQGITTLEEVKKATEEVYLS